MHWTEEAIRSALDGHFYSINHEGRVAVVDTLGGALKPDRAPHRPWDSDALRELWRLKREGHTIDQIEGITGRNRRSISEQWSRRRQWAPALIKAGVLPANVYDIRRIVCAVYQVGKHDFCSHTRIRKVCEARQVYYWIARKFTTRSLVQIGDAAGGRDHSTILHGVEKVAAQFEYFRPHIELALMDLGLEMPKQEMAAA